MKAFSRDPLSTRLCKIAALFVVALSVAPVSAQPVDSHAPAAVEAALTTWVASFNSGLPTASYFASEAVLVRGNGTFRGAGVIDDMEQRESKAGLRLTLKVDQVQFVGSDAATAVSRYTVSLPGPSAQIIPGVSLHVMRRKDNRWLVDAASFTRVQAPPPTPAGQVSNTQN